MSDMLHMCVSVLLCVCVLCVCVCVVCVHLRRTLCVTGTLDHVKELSQAWRDVLNMQFGITKAELHTLISSCSFANEKDFTELVSQCWDLFNPDDQKLCVQQAQCCASFRRC